MRMKKLPLFLYLALSLSAPALASAALPVQFPEQRFPDQRFPAPDPFADLERQQMTQETLMILRDMVNVMRQTSGLEPSDRERLENLSNRLDFLITRQQELSMRSRMGR
jgi:hypothetical protein